MNPFFQDGNSGPGNRLFVGGINGHSFYRTVLLCQKARSQKEKGQQQVNFSHNHAVSATKIFLLPGNGS